MFFFAEAKRKSLIPELLEDKECCFAWLNPPTRRRFLMYDGLMGEKNTSLAMGKQVANHEILFVIR